ncbi:unnamed protein product [Lymnaea stagnalis]|uniref:EGF-like domain-containing protein n=1 Tax=Lymnaea stagnalis TaxID=6523 RepID=A0AAV2HAP9_LYMST
MWCIHLFVFLTTVVCAVSANFYDIFRPCCHEGAQWSSASGRCDNYPAPVFNISDNDQAACLAIIEVCCMKQTHLQTCEDGKQTALENQVCAIRDSDPGAEQFRECCNCCQLGLVARTATPSCVSPGFGEPCDSKYRECCNGDSGGDNSTTPDEDIDECALFREQVCSHICVNTKVGFYCSCPDGLKLDPSNNRTCMQTEVENKPVYVHIYIIGFSLCTYLNHRFYFLYIFKSQVLVYVHIYIIGFSLCTYLNHRFYFLYIFKSQVLVYVHIYIIGFSLCTYLNHRFYFLYIFKSQVLVYVHIYIIGFSLCTYLNHRFYFLYIFKSQVLVYVHIYITGFIFCTYLNHRFYFMYIFKSQVLVYVHIYIIGFIFCTYLNHRFYFLYIFKSQVLVYVHIYIIGFSLCTYLNHRFYFLYIFKSQVLVYVHIYIIGFRPNGAHDCEYNNPCEQRCVINEESLLQCKCYDGYRLAADKMACEDIDECKEKSATCPGVQMCVNTRGGYTCVTRCPPNLVQNQVTGVCEQGKQHCKTGFLFNAETNKCEGKLYIWCAICMIQMPVCILQMIVFLLEVYIPTLVQVYFLLFSDLNECGLGIDSCDTGARCENTIGSYVCRRERHCGTGYTLDEESQKCIDNDECVLGTHNCNDGYRCQNIQGSFRCVPKPCAKGFRFDPVKAECIAIQCPVGLKPNEAGNCVDINECIEMGETACRRHQKCVNTRGSYHCRNIVNCPAGYEPSETNGCLDVNECERGTHKCETEQQCINKQGTYYCQCPRGMKHDHLGRCVDVDECSYGAAICPTNSHCVNTIGSFKCECSDGLVDDGNDACSDVDECQAEGICQQNCVNVLGSFFCSCNRGYQLRDDKRTCEDIDECTQFGGRGGNNGVCAGRCVNVPGSYKCECPEGWRLKPDGRSCEDVNECSELTAYCPHPESMCFNIRGGYKCPIVRCPDGFIKTNASGQQNSDETRDGQGVVCGRKNCKPSDVACARNKTKTLSWEFLSMPGFDFITAPLTLMTIQTIRYTNKRSTNLHLVILSGNEDKLFATAVNGDSASLLLLRPLNAPTDRELVLCLQNRDKTNQKLISRHVTRVLIFVRDTI